MSTGSNFDVAVVGAGAAGLTAAIGLAKAGFSVVAIEAAPFPGAENWSGCVYFCENLASPDILGPEGVEALAWERRLVERGFFTCDAYSLLGMKYRDPQAFRHCYTVLRPIYDHHLAQVALRQGVAVLASTTAESLIRHDGRVIGVCTNRGPLYADLVFLAEGDASHLVTREGYERFTDPRESAKFLQGIKQVIDLPPGAIEKLFNVDAEEGVAYEMLLRNGTHRGRPVRLNMGGFVYSNRQSLSIGLVLPAEHLQQDFQGDPNLLMEWFLNMPALRPWMQDGKRGVFGAKLIRSGGARDIPNLIDEGLAIGGAASAIGIDFPFPNFTGPATAMGLLISRAARKIRAEGQAFTRENLHRHYLKPLQESHYWKDVQFLRNWPGYVKRTSVFFGRNLDVILGSAYVWTRPRRWFITKWINWLRLLLQVAGPAQWRDMRNDIRHLLRALRLREVVSRPSLGKLLLDGTVNAMRDLAGSPRPNLPEAGVLRFHYSVAGGGQAVGEPPKMVRKWFRRMGPVLAAAARKVYTNDDAPLSAKLPSASQLLIRQINMLDLLLAIVVAVAAGMGGAFISGWRRFSGTFRQKGGARPLRGLYPRYALAVQQAVELAPAAVSQERAWDERLGTLVYQSIKDSHIHVHWPSSLPDKNAVAEAGLWHVCPAHVYEARRNPQGQLQVIVNFENCIKCETCWRTSGLVDWGRDGQHRFIYPVGSPVVERLLEAVQNAALARPALPRALDHWEAAVEALAGNLRSDREKLQQILDRGEIAELYGLLDKLEHKLAEFDAALAEEPRTVDRARADYLEMLARYAQQLALRMVEVLRDSSLACTSAPGLIAAHKQLLDAGSAALAKAEERARRTWDQRFAWAAADGRQLRFHQCAGLRRLLEVLSKAVDGNPGEQNSSRPWLQTEQDQNAVAEILAGWKTRLDAAFGPTAWRDIDRGAPLSADQDALLLELMAQIPAIKAADASTSLHAPLRKALLAELGRRDPSLAYRVAAHLWARDLARLRMISASLAQAAERWMQGKEWACFASMPATQTAEGKWRAEALYVPASGVRSLLLLLRDQLVVMPAVYPGLRIEPLATLGLRGAGLCRIVLDNVQLPSSRLTADADRLHRAWQVLSAADLTSIAAGMADQLCRRAMDHATSRVQFPGLFHDEEARDAIGKFGAVKKMAAQMGVRRYLIETLDHTLSPTNFSAASVERASLVKALAAEALGTSPGSLTYNAGQIFGGTGYSEDDILSKFYRDAAAWRYLGIANADLYHRHGEQLLRHWHADGRKLAAVEEEAQLFEEVTQRKALQPELDGVRVLRSGLRALVNEWQKANKERAALKTETNGDLGIAGAEAEFTEQLARQDAHLLAAKALLLRTHARLEQGADSELELALLHLWSLEVGEGLAQFQATVRRQWEFTQPHAARPLVDPAAAAPVHTYAEYLAAECSYYSGDFLVKPVDFSQPRFVPEMIASDPVLAARNQEIRDLLALQFGPPRQGLPYERYIEKRHRPDAADLDFCRQHGFFRMPIPRLLGGEERQKVDYYLVTTNAQRLADFAVSLTIQANTSIGTTPILLARDKDLPRAKKELSGFIENQPLHQDIQNRLLKLLARLPAANFERLRRILEPLHKQLHETILGQPALRVLLQRFARAWEQAVAGMQRFDWPAAQERLKEAAAEWKEACEQAPQMLGELARRSVACDLFLHWIAGGRISAFALTEPSAGSDTARVATRAVLRSAAVEREPDGALRFLPAGAREARYLVDAARLDFRADGVYYRWSEQAQPTILHFDEYDYESDDPARSAYYTHGPRTVHFSDVAQLRERDGRLWYDYWELTGAKMWITNGRMAGVFCLYAKTEEGITGFMVDRHAEGLLVGKDEAKMGQLGSPTNELSLQAVRVPRENVLGLEGRGQVNALETLNVGRAGLAMSAMAQMEGLIDNSRTFAQQNPGNVPDWVAWRLERMEQNRYTAEALAHEVVGRFEHPGTKSVRMESAISKMVVSELLHETIELAEDIHGLPGQTELYLVEKRKRDARIINIYEGTNEIQRFFILKDLAGEVGPRWSAGSAAVLPSYLGQEALALEALKGDFRQRLKAALDVFGEQLWQNPNLQANCFLLAEAAAWIKASDSTLGRLAWLEGQAYADDDAEPSPKADLARRAALRCHQEIRQRLAQFDEELVHLRRGFYAAEVRAASLLFNRTFGDDRARQPASRITKPLSILVVVEPAPGPMPVPQVAAGRLMEPYLTLNDADRSALETALRLRDQATAAVTIEVAAVGPRGMAHALREALSQGVDRARLVLTDGEFVSPDSAARALAAVLAEGKAFDLVLGGWGEAGSSEGACARLLAAGLGLPHAGKAGQLVVRKDDAAGVAAAYDASGRRNWECALPVAVAVEAGLPLRSFCMDSYLGGLASAVEVERWPKNLTAHKVFFASRASTVELQAVDAPSASLTPQEAAEVMLERLGISGNPTEPVQPFTGAIDDMALPPDLDDGVVALLSSDAQGRLEPSAMATLAAARFVAGVESAGAFALVSVPADETSQRRLVRQVRQEFTGAIILLDSGEGERSPQTDSRMLSDCWALLTSQPRLVVGGPWAEDLLVNLSRKGDRADSVALRVRRLDLEEDRLVVETTRNRGRLRVRQFLPGEQGMTCWLCLTAEAEVDAPPPAPARLSAGVQRWRPRPGGVYGRDDLQRLLGDLKQATGLVSLADADFIIDVGFGIRNRDGYETVIEPLERALRGLGVTKVAIGGSRKVTDELHLLPPDRQIGQSGVSVNPQIILAIGISGAPQHLNYISPRAVILAFNRDPQAPIITLNQRQPRPRVYAIVGDLFEMVPAFTTALQQASPSETARKCEHPVAALS